MLRLRAPVQRLLDEVEDVTGRSVQVMRDADLAVLATIQIARHGAPFHVLRYRPTDGPIDYFVAYQAGMLLRQFRVPPSERMDFAPLAGGAKGVEALLGARPGLGKQDLDVLPRMAEFVARWALLTLRSIPVGMRVDDGLARNHPELRELQVEGVAEHHRQNLQVLSMRVGRLDVPSTLLGFNAAQALHADRLLGTDRFTTPYRAAGAIEQGQQLLDIFDELPADPSTDRTLIDRWAAACGMTGWYEWTPYLP
jgi:hypothetical protein